MPQSYEAHAHMDANGQLTLKNLPFAPGEAVRVLVMSDETAGSTEERSGSVGNPAEGEVDALAILESLAGTVDAPADWAAEHDHYLYGTPKRDGRHE
jgi:hypothetical protein